MNVEAPPSRKLIDHPIFAKPGHQPERMDVIAGRQMLQDRQDSLHRQMGIDKRQLETDTATRDASEAETRRQWNEFGAEAIKTTVEPPKEVHDDPLL